MNAQPEILQVDDLCDRVRTYLLPEQVAQVRRAYDFGDEAHAGQHRKSGEPYIQHPLAVALILAEMHMDHETLIAAILHDVIEDTAIDRDRVSSEFGSEVAAIVVGLSKLTQLEFESQAETQARNFQRMLMAMADDIRVILVKLADRLHNMRTLGALAPEKRRRIARETLEIYAPIAQRLGINGIRLELEDLGFATLYPLRYKTIRTEMMRIRGNRKEVVDKIKDRIKRHLRQERLVAHVLGREKHIYSIYEKMREKHLGFSGVNDVYAFRVDSVDTCYRALGVLHSLYKPVPGKFKDYIAIPKANGYQSLHTVLFGPFGVPIEVQIRTNEMDQVAEAGIAAHWLYKSGDGAAKSANKRAREWLRGILEMQQQAGNSQEFLENVKIDLFPDEVYVFTPKGSIMALPRGATAVDFAYAIHTDLGSSCVACRINRQLAPLRTPLVTGQTVEIVTAPGARPNPSWLTFVVTGKARATIRHYLKNLQSDEARALGKRMLERELESAGFSLATLESGGLSAVLSNLKLESIDRLYTEIGLGNRPAPLVVRLLQPENPPAEDEASKARRRRRGASESSPVPLAIRGTEGMVVTFPKCCYPLPGDSIIGFLTAGRGIVVHQQHCANVADYRSAPEKWIDVQWAPVVDREFSVELSLDVINRRGTLATIAAALADANANIEDVDISERNERNTNMRFVVTVRDRKHLADVIRMVRRVKTVVRVTRKRA